MPSGIALPNAEEDIWTEAQYEMVLAHLEKLQDMLDEVRCTIPNVIDTLLARPATPRQLGENFLRAATTANGALSNFATAYSSDLTKKILAKSEADYENDPNLTMAYTLPASGWAATSNLEKRAEKAAHVVTSDGSADKEQDVASVLEEYKAKHAALSYQIKAGDDDIEITMKQPTVGLNFKITAENDRSANNKKYKIDCLGSTQTALAISRSLSSLPHYRDLRILLDLIVSYQGPRKTPCVACGSLLDKKMTVPVGRRLKEDGISSKGRAFEAFHEGCLPDADTIKPR